MDAPERYRRWAEHFNRRLAAEAWEDEPWGELVVALHLLSVPDPWPGTNAEWTLFAGRAFDRFEEASGEHLSSHMRALIMSIHPCRGVLAEDGAPIARA